MPRGRSSSITRLIAQTARIQRLKQLALRNLSTRISQRKTMKPLEAENALQGMIQMLIQKAHATYYTDEIRGNKLAIMLNDLGFFACYSQPSQAVIASTHGHRESQIIASQFKYLKASDTWK